MITDLASFMHTATSIDCGFAEKHMPFEFDWYMTHGTELVTKSCCRQTAWQNKEKIAEEKENLSLLNQEPLYRTINLSSFSVIDCFCCGLKERKGHVRSAFALNRSCKCTTKITCCIILVFYIQCNITKLYFAIGFISQFLCRHVESEQSHKEESSLHMLSQIIKVNIVGYLCK